MDMGNGGRGVGVFLGDTLMVGVRRRSNDDKEWSPDKRWNSRYYLHFTNCYAYAFDMLENPLAKSTDPLIRRRFTQGAGLQPGQLSNKEPSDQRRRLLFSGYDSTNRELIQLVREDMEGYAEIFDAKYEDVLAGKYDNRTDGYIVALFLRKEEDWHWYRRNSNGIWSHKQNKLKVTREAGIARDENGRDRPVNWLLNDNNIHESARAIYYTEEVGFYFIRLKR
jgi:hypothetical protein